jgi:hypothetical protein
MKNLVRAAAILSGVVGLSGAAAALAVGCGGDDTVVGYPGDGGSEASVDSSSDTSIPDSGSDAFSFDAGPPDLGKFYLQITQTGCAWLESCCGGPADFDMNSCLSSFSPATGGFLFTSPVEDPIDGGGQVTLDTAQANQCLSLIQGLSCSAPFTSTEMKAIRDACTGAIVGNIPAGSTGCQATIECQFPSHCEVDSGTCTAPYDAGAPCVAPGDSVLDSLSRCGRGYTGEPRYCEVGDFDTVLEAGTCAAAGLNGAACISPYECQSWLCDVNSTSTCVDSAQIFQPGANGTCAVFAPVDAGDGG